MDTIESITEYINSNKDLPFKSKLSAVEIVSGGLCNHVYRLIFEDNTSAVLKYHPPYVAYNRSVTIPQDKYFVEVKALELLTDQAWLNDVPLIRTPRILYKDEKNFLFIMEDAGKSLFNLLDLCRTDNKQENFNKEFIKKIANQIYSFLKFIAEKSNIKPSAHKDTFKSSWKILKDYYETSFKKEAKEFGIEKELESHFENTHHWLSPPDDSCQNVSLILGDLWPNSILIDVEKNIMWLLDWEVARFTSYIYDFQQLMGNLWMMKQNEKRYNIEKVDYLMKRLQFEFLGDENSDWRLQTGTHGQSSFIFWILVLVRIDHWGISDCASVIRQALNEIQNK